MKRNRIILSLIACTLTLTGCDDQIMEWQKADGNINSLEIPLELNEKIALYDKIKTYAAQYTPHMIIGLGLSADLYIEDEAYRKIADDNYQMFTTGNAMKSDAIMKSNGELDFTKMDNFLSIVPTDMKIYGHNFIWHTQQKQAYLKSLIAPEVIFDGDADDVCDNVVTNYGFEGGNTTGWTGLWGKYTYDVVQPGHESDYALHFNMTNETTINHDSQLFWPTGMLEVGVTYAYSFWVKSDSQLSVQFIGQNAKYGGIYKDTFTAATDWTLCTGEFTYKESDVKDIERIGIQFGGTPGSNLWVDDFKFGKKKETDTPATLNSQSRTGSGVTYIFKTPEEKKAALETAMEAWIKGMLEHIKNDNRFVAWDVINEPIADGSNEWRGINNVFGGTDGDGNPDTEPVEDPENGLLLNWADNHFYWGYYLGKGYATKAFELARQYAPANMKLYVNDYNLETSPNKLAALIDFVKYIDENNATGQPIVDGIGTQMHVTASSITREQIDAMFQTMAATGKLVRVTELDVALGTASPSAEQLELQANVYQMIFESYKANVPEAQQSGITIWTLSDNAAEHEYWLPDESPNLFDGNYNRKHAYKGVCDGIAGKDISEEFSGDDWKNISSEEESTSEE
ncbi:endo-1,4-beta-xylanase [Bacteroides clarus]|uniref:endo-1,4-beta-xylanase n=1 Tax=Bacteroides clarus TaxID=626929 RepID=UPI0021008890|nr:endo-1,4-beta-xylanase [Bacteroides clarus]MCQ1544205.1 endo-1,4-beta-xylanase [Bacteroides clarus]